MSRGLGDVYKRQMQEKLFKIAEVITPNIPEAELLSGIEIQTQKDMERAAEMIGRQFGCSVLLKGGHQRQDANDLLWKEDGAMRWFYGTRIENPNTHGTGCTLSSAIAANLAKEFELEESVKRAKQYLSDALEFKLDLGAGSGPMNHAFAWNRNE